jgi:hypothetical protein
MDVLNVLVDLVEQRDLDHIVNNREQSQDDKDQIGCVAKVLN